MQTGKSDMIRQLQQQINAVQCRKPSGIVQRPLHLGEIEQAFPDNMFSTGAVHELISYTPEATAATNGFIAAVSSKLLQQNDTCLWIGTRRSVFPPTLHLFGMDPARVIFIDLPQTGLALWVMEEGLRCKSLSAVVAEIPELTFKQSRRLQLAVEESLVTGFLHRQNPRTENVTACVSRWKVTPVMSANSALPGLGLPSWKVELLKVRNGVPGSWQIRYDKGLQYLSAQQATTVELQTRKAG